MEQPPEIGHQYAEGVRPLGRVASGNPHAQAQEARYLIARHADALTFCEERPEVAEAARILLADLCERRPEFLQDQSDVDPETGYNTYKADRELIRHVQRVLGEQS